MLVHSIVLLLLSPSACCWENNRGYFEYLVPKMGLNATKCIIHEIDGEGVGCGTKAGMRLIWHHNTVYCNGEIPEPPTYSHFSHFGLDIR
jgi:hypothetical protein